MKACLGIIAVWAYSTMLCLAQGFVNLNFENATVLTSRIATISGWTVNTANYVNGDSGSIPYNDSAIDAAAVSLEGTNAPSPSLQAIQGNFSIFLQGGSLFASDTNGAAIMQTGQISSLAQTMTYWGNALQVTFNNQLLAFSAISNTASYTIWRTDISAYAGQTGQLMFTAPWQTSAMLDNIKFSSLPIPEPGSLALLVAGGLLGPWRWKRS